MIEVVTCWFRLRGGTKVTGCGIRSEGWLVDKSGGYSDRLLQRLAEQSGTNQTLPMLGTPLSDEELHRLDKFLLSESLPEGTMTMDELDGYLTAIACGPVTLAPSQWLYGIWGWPEEGAVFQTKKEAEKIINLILRHMNGIIGTLMEAPETFAPMIHAMSYPGDSREYLDAEFWAIGFMRGVLLCGADWQRLFDDPEAAESFLPLRLLGAEDLTEEEDALVVDPSQRDELAKKLPAAIAAIYRFWLPYRKEGVESMAPLRREQPKVGRNDPCPCGSGKKFKKCCGEGGAAACPQSFLN